MTLRLKLVLATVALVTVGLVATGAITVALTRAEMIGRVDGTLAEAIRRPPPPPTTQVTSPQRPGSQTPADSGSDGPSKLALAVIVLSPDGSVSGSAPSGFAGSPDPLPDLTGLQELEGSEAFTVPSIDGSLDYRARAVRLRDGRTMIIAIPLSEVDATTARLVLIWVLASVGVLVLLSSVAWIIVGRGLAPVGAMAQTADEIAAGEIAAADMARRIDHEHPSTEVGRLGISLNTMLERIESAFASKAESEERLRRFVADASHELRTPTTAIRGYAELYRSGAAADPQAVGHAMERIEAEAIRMGDLVENLLLLARLDQGRPLRSEEVDLAQLVVDAVSDSRAVDPDRPIEISGLAPAIVTGDEARLRQVLANLMNNAIAHTAAATPVHVTLEVSDGSAKVLIEDEGDGIPEEERVRIFDRFTRLEAGRSRETGGAGLGLSIVASIVHAHGGSVSATLSSYGGARFEVDLPLAAP